MPEDKAKSTKAEEKKTPLDPLVDLPNARPGQEGVGLDVAETRLSHLGHQEVERILDELEKLSHDVSVAAGSGTWLTVNAAQEIILRDLGYEDEGELEDALKGSLESFIRAMPHLDIKIQEEEGSAKGMPVFRMKPPPPLEERFSRLVKVHVKSSHDLWRVLIKERDCRIEIPDLEFEISPDKRQIDTLYNFISNAVLNLGSHAELQGLPEGHASAIMDTVVALSACLDVEKPYTIVIHDPSGLSTLHPEDDCEIVKLGPSMAELETDLPQTA